ncbi:MAG TPA: 3'-5' exonuclease [Candidatus Saccharimonadales bacterium]|jgi:DNA polymerase-3 subunit epsilon
MQQKTQQHLSLFDVPAGRDNNRAQYGRSLMTAGSSMRHFNHRPIVFLDIETTGGSPHGPLASRITEIGALRVERGKVAGTFSQLVDPQCRIPTFITGLTGISDSMVKGKPVFADVADDLRSFLDGAIFVSHVVQFDYGFIKAEYARLDQAFNMDRLCSVHLDRRLYPEQPRHGLDRVIERLELTVANRHRAYDDAEVLWKVFEHEYTKDPVELFRAMEKLLVKCR